jgi:hypothetical protein
MQDTKKNKAPFVVEENDSYMPPYGKYSTDLHVDKDDPVMKAVEEDLKKMGITF